MTLNAEAGPSTRPLHLEEYERYGRQMILPGWGLTGQLKLKFARVAVVGAGGLGCPVLQYLAGAGVGKIDIFDHDTVSASNLHRQVLHTTDRVGMNKAESAALTMTALNPYITPLPNSTPITSSNALELLRPVDIVIDCTDRPLTRYLLSDAAVRLDVPLVSGAAISSAGQWAVYGGKYRTRARDPDDNGDQKDEDRASRACYRCVWPQVLPGSNGRCEDVGVWGMATGMVGTGMASEVIKLILGNEDTQPLLHMLHLNANPLIRTIRMKSPSPKCIACGPDATITDDLDAAGYEAFCGGTDVDEKSGLVGGEAGERISAQALHDLIQTQPRGMTIFDTRPRIEYEICSLPNTINLPLELIAKDKPLASLLAVGIDSPGQIVFLCKQGNDSQVAAAVIRQALHNTSQIRTGDLGSGETVFTVQDVRGGLRAWSKHVDPSFPLY